MKTLIYQGSKLIYESQHVETHDIGEVIYIGQEYIVSKVKVGKNCLKYYVE